MTVEYLIHAIVHQTTILIAQLATLGGARAPLAQVANQVFIDLVRELERQGVSRKVSADMFGLGLRTYRRKIQRLSESSTERGRSLWEVVLEFIKTRGKATRAEILLRFSLDDEAQVRAVLRDLCESQVVLVSGRGTTSAYRAASNDELLAFQSDRSKDGYDELLIALMYREGQLTLAELAKKALVEEALLQVPLARLAASGRIQSEIGGDGVPRFEAKALVIPLGAAAGWEAAVFDHFKAMVTTVLVRLGERGNTALDNRIGGSTYTIDVWPGHPLADEVYGTLKQVRSTLSDLRLRVSEYNQTRDRPRRHDRVVIYTGQSVISEGNE